MTGIDTNVLVYACDRSEPGRQETALNLLHAISDGALLWQVACEFVAASRKLGSHGFTQRDAWARLGDLLRMFPLVLPGPTTLDRAKSLHVERQWSFWDAMLVAACLEAGITLLYSEDLPGSQPPSGLQIVNPFA